MTEALLARFDKYFYGLMSSEEVEALEREMQEDQRIAAAYEDHKLLIAGIESAGLMKAIADQPMDKSVTDQASPKSEAQRKSWWLILAGLLIAGLLTLYVLRMNSNEAPSEQLYATFYEPDQGLPTAMGRAEDFKFDQGMVDYKVGSYEKAIQRWQPLVERHPEDIKYAYYLAMAYQADGDIMGAIDLLDKVIRSNKRPYTQKAKWYRALIAIQQGDKNRAQELLEGARHARKNDLLDDLEELD